MISRPQLQAGANSSANTITKSSTDEESIISKKRIMNESLLSPQLKNYNTFESENNTHNNNNNTTTGVTSTSDNVELMKTPKHSQITSSQGSQGLRRSVGLLNLSIEHSPNVEDSSSPKLTLKKNKLTNHDNDDDMDLNYINDVENWSPFKEPTTPTLGKKKPASLKRQASNSGSLSPFINDSQKPLIFSSSKTGQSKRSSMNMKFNKLRKMVSLDKMTYEAESPFDSDLHPLPNPSIHYQPQAKSSGGTESPSESPSRPARQKLKLDTATTSNSSDSAPPTVTNKKLMNIKLNETSQAEQDFITPNSYKFVKPLQTAFMSSGLLSKKNRKLSESVHPPETPCKKPSQLNVQPTTKTSFASSNLSNVITADSTSSPMINDKSTPVMKNDDRLQHDSQKDQYQSPSVLSSSSSLPRSARALNTNELRDCILKFANDFDDSNDSIFDNDGDFGMSNDPATPTRLNTAKSAALSKSLKLNLQNLSQTPSHKNNAPKTPVDASINDTSDLSNMTSFGGSNVSTYQTNTNPTYDEHLVSKFENVQTVGKGEFSNVYEITFQSAKYAVKRIKTPFLGSKRRKRIFEEVEILKVLQENEPADDEGKEYVINFINEWEFTGHLYIMTEFCENGSLDKYLLENGTISKLDEWRIWKILIEITMGLKYIHSCNILHLDLKPANIFITFEGSLKIGDFGMASKYPTPPNFEREGDREYIAPEIISQQNYDKPADIFSLGLIMVEIAANIILPDNGVPWQKLRSGDLSDAGRLSSTELHYNLTHGSITSKNSTYSSLLNDTGNTGSSYSSVDDSNIKKIPPWTPTFLVDGKGALDKLVKWMIDPSPSNRPTAAAILDTLEAQFIEVRRKAGAVIFEGEYGPPPDQDEDVLMNNDLKNLNFNTGSGITLTTSGDIMDEGEW